MPDVAATWDDLLVVGVDQVDWDWFVAIDEPVARVLTFVRNVGVERLESGFGMKPGRTEMLTWVQAEERFIYSGGQERAFNDPPYYLRTAQLGLWSVAFERNQILSLVDARLPSVPDHVARFEVTWTITTGILVRLWRPGEEVSFFEASTGHATSHLAHILDADPSAAQALDGGTAALTTFAAELDIEPLSLPAAQAPMRTTWRDR